MTSASEPAREGAAIYEAAIRAQATAPLEGYGVDVRGEYVVEVNGQPLIAHSRDAQTIAHAYIESLRAALHQRDEALLEIRRHIYEDSPSEGYIDEVIEKVLPRPWRALSTDTEGDGE